MRDSSARWGALTILVLALGLAWAQTADPPHQPSADAMPVDVNRDAGAVQESGLPVEW